VQTSIEEISMETKNINIDQLRSIVGGRQVVVVRGSSEETLCISKI
jgi:hypothetical protein